MTDYGWSYKVVNGTGATVVCAKPCLYGGYKILGNAGALTMDVYDSLDASGTKLDSAIALSAASSLINQSIHAQSGLTVNLSGDPTDGLVMILYKT